MFGLSSHYGITLYSPHPLINVFILLGTIAATVILAWHAHVHMNIILIPPLIYLYACGGLPDKILNSWLLAPFASAMIGVFLISVFVLADILDPINDVGVFFIAFSTFVVNLCLLFWCRKKSCSVEKHTGHATALF